MIGIISVSDYQIGLWKDTESLLFALNDVPIKKNVFFFKRGFSATIQDINVNLLSISPSKKFKYDYIYDLNVNFKKWIRSIRLLIVCEILFYNVFDQFINQLNGHVIYIPNMDYPSTQSFGDDINKWITKLNNLSTNNRFHIVTKTEYSNQFIKNMGFNPLIIPWSISDEIKNSNIQQNDNIIYILSNNGIVGEEDNNHLKETISAFNIVHSKYPNCHLIIKTIDQIPNNFNINQLEMSSYTLINRYIKYNDLLYLYAKSTIVCQLSKKEGFGLSLLESMHLNKFIVATDISPMNEILREYSKSILCKPRIKTKYQLAEHGLLNEFDLAESIIKSIEIANNIDDCQSNQLICHKRQNNFKQKYIELVNQLLL